MIIGITGTIGAGKGTVVDYLKTKGFKHFAARDFIVSEIKRRGLPENRDTMTSVSNDLRAMHGPTYIIEELYKAAEAAGGDAIIESVREVPGAIFLKAKGACLLSVDADQHIRYNRIVARGLSTDHVTFDTFISQEKREMESTDPNKQNILGVMALADYHINNAETLEELHQRVDEMLSTLKK